MRWVLTLIVALGLGLSTFWMLDPTGTTPPPPSPMSESEGTGRGSDPAADAATAEAAPEAANGGADGPLVREESTPSGPSTPGPRVQVVRGDDKQPVANAIVYYLSERDPRVRSRGRMGSYREGSSNASRWEAPELFGQRTRTDDDGMARLPGGTGRWMCSAKKDSEFGFLVVPKSVGQHVIELQADEELRIVVKHHGVPARPAADIPVGVLQEYRSSRTSRIWRGTTDERGHAVVRHLQLLRRAVSKSAGPDFRERFAAIAMVPSAPATMLEFDGRPLQENEVTLTLPPQGSIVAQLVDHGGKPLLTPAQISFSAPNPRKPGAMRISSSYLRTSSRKPTGALPVELPYAPVGMAVQLSARYPHDRKVAVSQSTAGPTTVGEQVTVKIPPLASHTVFAGRFVAPSGQGVGEQEVSITIWKDDKVHSRVAAETIRNGQWDLVLSGRTEAAQWRMEFRCERQGNDDGGSGTWLGARIDLPPWPPGRRIELGTILLGELPPLAEGLVVDDRGEPVANATVKIEQEQPKSANATSNNVRELGGPDLQLVLDGQSPEVLSSTWFNSRYRNRDPWRTLNHLTTRTDEAGAFRIFAPMPAGTLRVKADTGDHASQTVPLPGPSSNLRIELPRNGVLMGSVLVPEWLPDSAVTVKVTAHGGAKGLSSSSTRIVKSSGGRFVLQPIRPGRYDVLVQMRNLKAPMAKLEDITIHPGLNKEPRLQQLDVRQALFRYSLRAFDEAGQPFLLDGPIQARFQQPDGTEVRSGFRWQKGKAELITVHPNTELTFFGRGFEPMTKTFGPGEHEVFLKKLQPARVQLSGLRQLSGPTRKVRISALMVGDTGLPSSLSGTDQMTGRGFSFARWDLGRTSGGWLEQSDIVEIPLMKAGKYNLIFRAHATESTRTPQTQVTLGTFELRPDGTITNIPLDMQAITDALQKIDKQWQDRLERNKKRSNR